MYQSWDFSDVENFIDDSYPDLGRDCPLFPVATALFSAALLKTTDVDRLAEFTGYSPDLIKAIAWNMKNNHRWTDNGYDTSRWFTDGSTDLAAFFTDIELAEGSLWQPDATQLDSADIYGFIRGERPF